MIDGSEVGFVEGKTRYLPSKLSTATHSPQITQCVTCLGQRNLDTLGMSEIAHAVKKHSKTGGKRLALSVCWTLFWGF